MALVITLALLVAIPSRFVRARLQFSPWLLLAFPRPRDRRHAGASATSRFSPRWRGWSSCSRSSISCIALLANPWREHRPSDRFPAIVQDVTLIGLFTVVATVLMKEQLLTTSAVGAVVVGFALQDTLGNLFSGLAIQIEKPFRVGHWIAVGDREGQVQEITWRATKLRTKAGQFLIVPNGIISKEAILNYSEPTVPTRLVVEVGASYMTPPNEVQGAVAEALRQCPLVLSTPRARRSCCTTSAASALTVSASGSGLATTRSSSRRAIRCAPTSGTRSGARTSRSRGRSRSSTRARSCRCARRATCVAAANRLGGIDLFSTLPDEARLALSRTAQEHIFAAGEAIVRQGDAGDSMYVVLSRPRAGRSWSRRGRKSR